MANKSLFSSLKSLLPRTDSYNEAGGRAYKFTPRHALAQMAATGCFNGVYYASAQSQLDEMRKLIDQVDDNVFLAKLAVYARERDYMKDMPWSGRRAPVGTEKSALSLTSATAGSSWAPSAEVVAIEATGLTSSPA